MKMVQAYKVKSGKNVVMHKHQLSKLADDRFEEVILHIPHNEILKWAEEIRTFDTTQKDGEYEV